MGVEPERIRDLLDVCKEMGLQPLPEGPGAFA
jgi:hypothetical protein